MGSGVKEAQTAEEVQLAKEQARKEGTASLFEDVAAIKVKPTGSPDKRPTDKFKGVRKAKPTFVCIPL